MLETLKEQFTAKAPPELLRFYVRMKRKLFPRRYARIPVEHHCKNDQVFHCSTQKTASMWIKEIMRDELVYKYSGLLPMDIERVNKADVETFELPSNKIVSPLYFDFEKFSALKKDTYRGFYVIRDPRDLLVSHYFSKRYSHKRNQNIDFIREKLEGLDKKEGLLYLIDYLNEIGNWGKIRTWLHNSDPNIKTVKFEDLTGPDSFNHFNELFDFLDIKIPEDELKELLEEYDFNKLSGGRSKGEEKNTSHFRKGVAGDWVNHFDDDISNKMNEVVGDLIQGFAYS